MRTARMIAGLAVAAVCASGTLVALGSPPDAALAADPRSGHAAAPMTPSTPVPTEQTEAEAQAILDELEQSFSVVEADTINAISVVNLEYPDVASMFSVDEDAWVFEVRYFDGADRVRIEQNLAAITAIGMTAEYPIEVGTAPFSTAALMATAAEIARGSGTWPDVTGGEVGMLTAYQDHGHISVWVRERDGDDTIEVDGISITFMSVPADWEPPYSLQ